MFALKAAYFIIFESSNSIFLPEIFSNIINYKETVIAYTYRLRLLDLFVIAAQNMPYMKVFKMKSAEINKWDKMGSTKSSVVCRIRYSYCLNGMNALSQCTFTIKNVLSFVQFVFSSLFKASFEVECV